MTRFRWAMLLSRGACVVGCGALARGGASDGRGDNGRVVAAFDRSWRPSVCRASHTASRVTRPHVTKREPCDILRPKDTMYILSSFPLGKPGNVRNRLIYPEIIRSLKKGERERF